MFFVLNLFWFVNLIFKVTPVKKSGGFRSGYRAGDVIGPSVVRGTFSLNEPLYEIHSQQDTRRVETTMYTATRDVIE